MSKQEDPLFEPARPAIPACVRLPSDVGEGTLISDSHTAAVSDLFNGCYEILLEALVRFFLHVDEGESELTALADTAVDSMFTVIAPLGRLLTRLPVGPEEPEKTAGPTFDIFRRSYLLPHRKAARMILQERLQELADGSAAIGQRFIARDDADARATMGAVEVRLRALATTFTLPGDVAQQ